MFTKWFKDPGSGLFTDNSELTGLYVGGSKIHKPLYSNQLFAKGLENPVLGYISRLYCPSEGSTAPEWD